MMKDAVRIGAQMDGLRQESSDRPSTYVRTASTQRSRLNAHITDDQFRIIEQFRDAMVRRGISVPGEIIADGKTHRADAEGKHGRDDASYWLHLDHPVCGGFQNWRDGGGYEKWRPEGTSYITAEDRARIEGIRREREAEEEQRRKDARDLAVTFWNSAEPAKPKHPYLKRKRIGIYGIRQRGKALVVPIYSPEGTLQSIQYINPDGTKRFLSGGRTKGCFFCISGTTNNLCVCEGYATGMSIHEATGTVVLIAFSAGNMTSIALHLRAAKPNGKITICADNDAETEGNPGVRCATEAARAAGALLAIPPESGDFNDLFVAKGAEAVRSCISEARSIEKEEVAAITEEIKESETVEIGVYDNYWPVPIGEEALVGPVGDFIAMVAPQTEADPAAILLQFLAAAGSLIGPEPHIRVGADRHPPRLYVVVAGETSRGRKGTGWSWTKQVFAASDQTWLERIASGLSSGEGLVWAVRDEIVSWERPRKGASDGELQRVVTDPGVEDKRLLVVEGEFASALRVGERDGSTLSTMIRNAWDLGPTHSLRILTKKSPCASTNAHISIIGHITTPELRRYLTSTEAANGYGNRILWVLARRSKLLPEGGYVEPEALELFGKRLAGRLERARELSEVRRSTTAAELWRDVYGEVSRDNTGLFGAVTARAEAQVTRLSLFYALLDGSSTIEVDHLSAALEVWRYCEDSARFIFGKSTGDPVADEILTALRATPDGLTRTELRDLFHRHVSRGRMSSALELIERSGSAVRYRESTKGRSAERWRLGPDKSDKSDKKGA